MSSDVNRAAVNLERGAGKGLYVEAIRILLQKSIPVHGSSGVQ